MTDPAKMAIEALRLSKALLEVIEQTPGNVWHVAADDPETACCDTMSAVDKALAALEQAVEPVAEEREKLAGEQGEQCERCQGNGEIVTDWDRYMHAHDGDVGDEAVADCPDCSGTGRIEDKSPLPTLQRLGQEFDAGEGWSEDLRKIRFRLVWEKAAEGDAAREADKKGTPEMALGDGWRANEQETSRLISVLDQVIKSLATPSQPDPQSREPSLTVADAWQDLVDKDDRTSPEEYPDMALITREELADYMQSAQSRGQAFDGEGEACKPDRIKARADAIAHLTVPEDGNYKGNREYKQHFRIARDAALAAFEDITALSSAKRGEEG